MVFLKHITPIIKTDNAKGQNRPKSSSPVSFAETGLLLWFCICIYLNTLRLESHRLVRNFLSSAVILYPFL